MAGHIIAGQRFPADDGSADPQAAAALAAYAAGEGSEHAALTALAHTRLLVPVVATATEQETGRGPEAASGPDARGGPAARRQGRLSRLRREKASEMALPLLVGNDGRKAVLAFTSSQALARWRPDGRPVPVPAAEVWRAGLEEASAVVVDLAGPVTLTVEGARLAALAAGQPVPEPHEDPDLIAAAVAAVTAEPLLTGVALAAGGADCDLALRVRLAEGTEPASPDVRAAVQRAAGEIAVAAGGRLRRGLAVTVATAGKAAGTA